MVFKVDKSLNDWYATNKVKTWCVALSHLLHTAGLVVCLSSWLAGSLTSTCFAFMLPCLAYLSQPQVHMPLGMSNVCQDILRRL
jgi:hypothetical protein